MIKRCLAALFAVLAFAGAGQAGQIGQCWYPVDGAIGCVETAATDADGYLKPGIHAIFTTPVARYGHGVLGDTPEWGGLQFIVQGSPAHGPYFMAELVLPESRIFEDIAPRLADMTGDGQPEIVVVETHQDKGARLSVYQMDHGAGKITLLAATPYIGTPFRWLAPVGMADFNGDGDMDVAYVDRPHLAKTLRLWSLRGGELRETGRLQSVTNHQIGDDFISSGVRNCGEGPEMVMLDASRHGVVVVRLEGENLGARKLGRYSGPAALKAALDCKTR